MKKYQVLGRRVRASQLAAFVALLTLGFLGFLATIEARPAAAQDCTTIGLGFEDEAEAIKDWPAGCRHALVAPNVGENEINTQEQLGQEWELYDFALGSPNYVWYGEVGVTTVSTGDRWAYCETDVAAGDRCAVDRINGAGDLLSVVFAPETDKLELQTISYDEFWIALICGNYEITSDKPDAPVPSIPIFKYFDANGNGHHDPGEAPMEGVSFTVARTASLVNQDNTSYTVTTDADGTVDFKLHGEGPGTYTITEVVPDGYYTTTPSTRTVEVGFGGGAQTYPTQTFGNAFEADAAKVSMEIDLPDRIEAGVTETVDVDVTLVNNGPLDEVAVVDTVELAGTADATGTPDCTFDQISPSPALTLREGEPVTVTVSFTMVCDRPSHHTFTANDTLSIDQPSTRDPVMANNTLTVETGQPVWADTDLSVSSTIDCPSETMIGQAEQCTVTHDVANTGFGPIDATVAVDVSGLADCTIDEPNRTLKVADLGDGEERRLSETYTVSCANRSFHPFDVVARITADDIHVVDTDETNNSSTASDTMEVFEDVDLSVADVDLFLSCDEYFAGDPFTCRLVATAANQGPADQVVVDITANASAEGCVTSPNPQLQTTTIGAGDTATVDNVWSVGCDDPEANHLVTVEVCVTNNEAEDPHARDVDESNNCATVVALPTDLKPLSDPNTISLKRGGVTSVAILSTADFNPVTEVDTSTITFGPTGTEAEPVRCATEGEDANGDGYANDLVCHFKVKDLDLTLETELVYITGRLNDGTRFVGTDQVRVVA